jgi:hypothetical protein
MTGTVSQRYIAALAQLPQFLVTLLEDPAECRVINALTGAVVEAVPDPDELHHEILQVTFAGGQPFQVHGGLYLEIQAVEAERHWADSPENGSGPIAKKASALLEHLRRKHAL